MNPKLVRIDRLILLFACSLVSIASPFGLAEEVWRFDNVANVGGHSIKVVGQPKVVEEGGAKAVRFDGEHDGIFVQDIPLTGAKAFTIEVLLFPAEGGRPEQRFFHLQDGEQRRAMIETRLNGKGAWWLDTYLRNGPDPAGTSVTLIDPKQVHPTNRWYWVALRYGDGHMAHYINGEKQLEADLPFGGFSAGQISVGVRQNLVYWFKGDIREIRFHREAVPEAKLQRVK